MRCLTLGWGVFVLATSTCPAITQFAAEEEAGALAADDECTAGAEASEGGCALNALQLRAGKLGGATDAAAEAEKPKGPKLGESMKLPVFCSTEAACPKAQVCVSAPAALDALGMSSQCVDCADEAWEADCADLTEEMRLAAAKACGKQCPSARQVCREEASGDEEWCQPPYKCAVPAGQDWGKCILCTAKYFKDYCYGWLEPFATAAKERCKMDCNGKRLLTHHRKP